MLLLLLFCLFQSQWFYWLARCQPLTVSGDQQVVVKSGGDTSSKFLFGKSASGAVRFLDSLSWTWQGILLFYVWTFPIQGLNISPIPTPQTAGFGKLTCKGKVFKKNTTDNVNDWRYVLGKRYAIRMRFSQREVLRETSIIESNLSSFFYNKCFPLYEYKITERVQSESKFTLDRLDTLRRTETNSMRV